MFGAVEKKGHHGERNPATAEKDTAKQHQLAWDGTKTGTLHQLGETRYRPPVDCDLAVIGKRLNAKDPNVIAPQPPPDGAGEGDVVARFAIIPR